MSAAFYEEHLRCDRVVAERINWFMDFKDGERQIAKASVWSKGGKFRVYINLKSQNSRSAILHSDGVYYDAVLDDVFICIYIYDFSRIRLSQMRSCVARNHFSGAATRDLMYEFQDSFYRLKEDRDGKEGAWC